MPEIDRNDMEADLAVLKKAASLGGEIALSYFCKAPEQWEKADKSLVSEADIKVDRFLRETLCEARPDYGWLSEETEDDLIRLEKTSVFVIDPIDGTRAFLNGQEEWCLSLAIVRNGHPVVGVIYNPVHNEMFTAIKGHGALLNGRRLEHAETSGDDTQQVLVAGPKHLIANADAVLQKITYVPKVRSLAYRFAQVAAGRVDVALAQPRARDWDVAAADLMLQEAGYQLTDLSGSTLLYNKSSTKHPALLASSAKLYKRLHGIVRTP